MSKILLLGGSGFVSGTLAREALLEGHEVWTITRGERPLPAGVHGLFADRRDSGAFALALGKTSTPWDLAVDCIGFSAEDARQDLAHLTRDRVGHLVFISTDSVISSVDRPWRIDEAYDRFSADPYGRGKRDAEQVLLGSTQGREKDARPPVTILRPGHIYGPGSRLGPLPRCWRDPHLVDRIRRGEPLPLVGGGFFLQQPVLAADLWKMAHSCLGNARTHGQIYFAAGPEVAQCRDYYGFVAEALGVPAAPIREESITQHLQAHPEAQGALCHRVYSTDKARAHGLVLPSTPLREGIRMHVRSLESALG